MKNIFTLVSKICVVLFGILTALVFTAGSIMNTNAAAVSNFLNAKTQIVVEDEEAEDIDNVYYKTDYSSVEEERKNAEKLCREVVSEGAVLLKNEENALPLQSGATVSLFGAGCAEIAIGGGGSSMTSASYVNLKSALETAGLKINMALYDWYSANVGSGKTYGRKVGSGVGAKPSIGEAPWSVLPSAKSNKSDVALFVLTRIGSEDADSVITGGDKSDMTNGNYLLLSPQEISVLKGIKEEKSKGNVKKIVVLMNTSNQVQCDFIENSDYGIDAVLWCGTLGSTGSLAVGDILAGKVNPSGRLSDTFWNAHYLNPVYANFGYINPVDSSLGFTSYVFNGTTSSGANPINLDIYKYGKQFFVSYVVYQEGIYNGYRYTETRYEDKITKRENVGEFDYNAAVAYPFGYGLSYTSFSYSDFKATYDAKTDEYEVTLKVKNTGKIEGKETVQVYLQKPYTAYDERNGIEKSSVELAGFAKTSLLKPNGEENVTIKVDKEFFAAYDANGAKTYILDAGDYYLTAAKNAHDAVNNILAAKGKTTADGMDEKGEASLVKKFELSFGIDEIDAKTYSVTDDPVKSGYKSEPTNITNKFDEADINRYSQKGENSVKYVSRKDWNGTVKFGFNKNYEYLGNHAVITLNAGMEKDLLETDAVKIEKDDTPYPTFGSTKTSYTLIDMRYDDEGKKLSYSDKKWDDLLDQLSWQDYVDLLSCGERMTVAIASISKPATIDHNGAIGVNQRYNVASGVNRGFAVTNGDEKMDSSPAAYPCNAIVASTFNAELIETYGEAWGEDALWAGYSGLYGPGINMHRGSYGGRSFEYYSEDAFLSGKICARLCKGIESKGIYVYLKHAVLNDQETGRRTIATWANEQTIRENYLRAFEIAIEEGGARNVMTGLNKIGPTFTGMSTLCNDVLREEFGMRGFVVTDYINNNKAVVMPASNIAGNDLPDRDFSKQNIYKGYEPGNGYGNLANSMRDCVHRILYTVAHSSAMNGISSSTRIIPLTPNWIYLLSFAKVMCFSLFIFSLLMLASVFFFPFVPEKISAIIKGKDKGNGDGCNGGDGGTSSEADSDQESLVGKENKETKKQVNPVKNNAKETKKDPFYAWAVRAGIALVLVIVLVVNTVATVSLISGNNRKIAEIEAAAEKNKYDDETKGGEGVTDHIFEAENALFMGTTLNGNGKASTTDAFKIIDGASGCAVITNIGTKVGGEQNELIFKINSDKKVKVTMECYLKSDEKEVMLTSAFVPYVNGRKLSATAAIESIEKSKKVTGDYYIGKCSLPIILKEGANEIIFKSAFSESGVGRDFDKINIKTSANLTFTPSYWDFTGVSVIKEPTFDTQGEVVFADNGLSAKYSLPKISSGIEQGLYERKNVDGKAVFSLSGQSVKVYSASINPHTLTLKDGAKFDDGSVSKTVNSTENLVGNVSVTPPEKMSFVGWVDEDNPSTLITDISKFVMPDRDVAMRAVFEVDKYATAFVDEEMKYDPIDAENISKDPTGCPINIRDNKDFDQKLLKTSYGYGQVVTDEIAERAFLFSYPQSTKAGGKIVLRNPFDYSSVSGKKSMKVRMQNQGEETITVKFWHSQGSSVAYSDKYGKTLTLEKNESATFVLEFDFSCGYMITHISFETATENGIKLALTEWIKKGSQTTPDPEQPDVPGEKTYTATIKGNATFSDGKTQLTAKAGTAINGVLTGSDATKTLAAWIIDDKTVVLADGYSMPEKDVVLTPVAVVASGKGLFNFGLPRKNTDGVISFDTEENAIQNYSAKCVYYGVDLINGRFGRVYEFGENAKPSSDGTSTGASFRIMTRNDVAVVNSTLSYSFKNYSDKEIEFEVYLRGSGRDASAVTAYKVKLAAGETVTVEVPVTNYSNTNILTYFRLAEGVVSGKIGVSLYVK